jgi:hypothetical protein
MLKKSLAVLAASLALAACASSAPRIIQPTAGMPEVRLTSGMATQLEMPDSGHVQSIAVGNPALVTAEKDSDVVSLVAKAGAGETNLIIRSRDEDGKIKVYQYHIIVQER